MDVGCTTKGGQGDFEWTLARPHHNGEFFSIPAETTTVAMRFVPASSSSVPWLILSSLNCPRGLLDLWPQSGPGADSSWSTRVRWGCLLPTRFGH